MEIETLKTNTRSRKNSRPVNMTLPSFDYPYLIEEMKHTNTWAKGELNAMVLLKTPEKQIVLTVLQRESEIVSFQSNDSVTIQIIEGKLKFQTRKISLTMDKGQFLTLNEKTEYNLTNKAETAFLLTIDNSKIKPREDKMLWCL